MSLLIANLMAPVDPGNANINALSWVPATALDNNDLVPTSSV